MKAEKMTRNKNINSLIIGNAKALQKENIELKQRVKELEKLKTEQIELIRHTLTHFIADPYSSGISDQEITECLEKFKEQKK